MRKIFTFILALIAGAGTIFAETVDSGTCGKSGNNLTWTLDDKGELTISGTGEMKNWVTWVIPSPWYNKYRSDIKSVVIENGVTSIGDAAFYDCPALESVDFPTSLKTIGEFAFGSCTALTYVYIYNALTSIGTQAFASCTSLIAITVTASNPNYCSEDGVLFNKAQTELIQCPGAKTGAYTIPSSVATIDANAFSNCTSLTSVTIPSGVTDIGDYAFANCSGLESLTCEATTAPTCKTNCFTDVPNNIPVYVPKASLADYNKDGWTYFTNIQESPYIASGTCGNNVTWTLTNEGLLTISGTGEMENWENKAFVPWYSYRTSIQRVEVEAGVTSIGNHAFAGTSVSKAFLSEGILTIGTAAFQDCDNLSTLSIPSTVTKVNNDAFEACANLTQLVFYPLTAPTLLGWNQALQLQKQTTIYIPDDAYASNAYSSSWGTGKYTYQQMALNKVQVGDLWYHFNMCLKQAQVRSGEYTFSSITIPSSADYDGDTYPVTSIGLAAFRGCTKLTSVVLSEGMTEIGDAAFMESAVTSVSLPATLTSIGQYAFASRKSNNLTVTSYAIQPPACGANCFYGLDASKSKLNVLPPGYNAYKNDAKWSAFTTIVAMDVIQGPFTFKVDVEAQTAALTAYDNSASQTAVTIPNTLILGGETYAVTSIKEYVFSNNTTIKSVVIPDNVSVIGYQAFAGCTALSEVKLPATTPSIVGSSCFYKCNSLPVIDGIRYADYLLIEPIDKTKSTYTIKSDTRLIDSYAFWMCENLTSIVLPNTVEKIGSYAFGSCTSLVSVVLPDGLAELPNYVFNECTSLSSITIPKTVQKIGWRAFVKCSSLQQIDLPEGLEEIGGQAFHRCAALKKCTIPSTVQKMTNGEYMEIPGEEDYQTFVSTFSKCDALDTIVILSKTIGEAAYLSQYFDWYIPHYVLGENIEKVGHNAFAGTVDLNSVQLSSSIKTICKAAFSGQGSMQEIDLKNVTTIEDSAFYWTYQLQHVTLNHVEAIGKGAFVYTPLKELHLPACLKTIGEKAFSNCLSLQSITCEATEPPVLGDQCFSYSQVKDIPVTVPAKSVTAYRKATGWKEFNNYQVIQTPLRYEFRDDNLTATVIKYEEGTPYYGDVVIPSTVEHDGKTYTVTTIGRNAFFDCTELTSISIPPTVQNIYTDAFWGCTNLQAVHISDLSKWCTIHISFEDAPALHAHPLTYSQQLLLNDDVITDLVIPDEATAVNPYAFANDTALESVTFPASMSVIQTGAFKGCKNIKTITCYAEEVPFANTYTFDGIDKKIPVYVPAESVDAYKDADYWNDFENILPLPNTTTALEAANSQEPKAKSQKILRNGQLLILRDGKTYNVMGVEVR